MRLRNCALLFATAFVALANPAAAQILTNVGGGNQRTDGGKVVGITLTSFGQTITSLGFYDFGDDGLSDSYQLGLWDASQNLLATTIVTPTSPLTSGFRYAAIPPVTIGSFANPQQFTIGALLSPNMSDIWLDGATLVMNVGFASAGTGLFTNSGTLVLPTTADSSPYYVVNANGPAPAVPEPCEVALLVSTLVCLCSKRCW